MGDQHIVLDSHATDSGEINSRLDGDDHSRTKLIFPAGLAKAWKFVNLAADAVPEAVAEFFCVAGFINDIAGDAVGLLRGDAGAEKLDRGVMGLVDDLVKSREFCAGPCRGGRCG